MWLIISVPSKPASLMAFIFSRTEPLTPTVAHMMPFLMARFGAAASGPLSSAANAPGANAASASAPVPVFRNSRRCIGQEDWDGYDLYEFGHTGHGHRGDVQLHLPVELIGHQLLLRVHGLLPGDFLAGVGGHAAHDSHERAVRHPLAIVDRPAVADAGEQFIVLVLIHRSEEHTSELQSL